jgi:hypothetical protein
MFPDFVLTAMGGLGDIKGPLGAHIQVPKSP